VWTAVVEQEGYLPLCPRYKVKNSAHHLMRAGRPGFSSSERIHRLPEAAQVAPGQRSRPDAGEIQRLQRLLGLYACQLRSLGVRKLESERIEQAAPGPPGCLVVTTKPKPSSLPLTSGALSAFTISALRRLTTVRCMPPGPKNANQPGGLLEAGHHLGQRRVSGSGL